MKTERAVQERAATRPTDVRFWHKADIPLAVIEHQD
jgi:hypothetical protein